MGNSASRVIGCFVPVAHDQERVAVCFSEPLDEGLGHSFCYIRPSIESPHLSPGHSDICADSEAHSLSFQPSTCESATDKHRTLSESIFKSISGASVSANTSTPHTAVCHDQFHSFTNVPDDRHAAFESTASFTSLPLQLIPRGVASSGPISGTFSGPMSGTVERGFMSGPIERGFMSGPLERMSGPLEKGFMSGPLDMNVDRSHFSAPLAGVYLSRRRNKSISQFISAVQKPVKKMLSRTLSKTSSSVTWTERSLFAPVRQFVWRNFHKRARSLHEFPSDLGYASSDVDSRESHNLQWAQGKAGEDRVHVVVSEEHGWLFVGIYDGFNGPDAPDFLMRNLYRAIHRELQGLLWDQREGCESSQPLTHTLASSAASLTTEERAPESMGYTDLCTSMGQVKFADAVTQVGEPDGQNDIQADVCKKSEQTGRAKQELGAAQTSVDRENAKGCSLITYQSKDSEQARQTFNQNTDASSTTGFQAGAGIDADVDRPSSDGQSDITGVTIQNLSGPNSNHLTVGKGSSMWRGRSFIRNHFRHRQSKKKEGHRKMYPQRYDFLHECKEREKVSAEGSQQGDLRPKRQGTVNHSAVLEALAHALTTTEEAYLDMADHALEENPELALIGSCVLVTLVKDKDVYVMNVGDSRAIVAQNRRSNCDSSDYEGRIGSIPQELERIVEESPTSLASNAILHYTSNMGPPACSLFLKAIQLSTDHNTSIEEEICRIKAEHPDDNCCILNDRVKGRLKVTRAFGAGFLKQPRWNNAILKMFQIDYVGTAPYISCMPALCHYRLGPDDRFLILSSDGLYQYFTNEEVVSHVEWFMEKFPEGDPAQYLIEELLFRAAKKAGLNFHELLDIPQGDRRKYHDDVSVMVISLEGKIWKSSG